MKNFLRRTLAEVLSEDPDINPGHSYEDDTGYTYDDDQLSTGGVEDIADEAETEFLRWAGVKEDDPEGEDLLWDIWEAVPGRDIASDILNRVPWSSAFISAIFLRAGIEFFSTAQHKQYMIKALENLNSEYDNIHQIITQENQKSVEILEVFKVSIKEHLDVKDEEDVKLHRDHNEELKTCNQHASDNCSQHKVHSSWQYIHHILNLVDGKCFKTA